MFCFVWFGGFLDFFLLRVSCVSSFLFLFGLVVFLSFSFFLCCLKCFLGLRLGMFNEFSRGVVVVAVGVVICKKGVVHITMESRNTWESV